MIVGDDIIGKTVNWPNMLSKIERLLECVVGAQIDLLTIAAQQKVIVQMWMTPGDTFVFVFLIHLAHFLISFYGVKEEKNLCIKKYL